MSRSFCFVFSLLHCVNIPGHELLFTTLSAEPSVCFDYVRICQSPMKVVCRTAITANAPNRGCLKSTQCEMCA